jgi:hypothetical protein
VTDVDRVERDLAEACWTIAADWDASLHGKRETPGVGFVRGTREAPLPVPVATLDDRAETCGRLMGWALMVAEELDLQPTTRCETPRRTVRVPFLPVNVCGCGYDGGTALVDGNRHRRLRGDDAVGLARFVSTHAQWLASHEAGSEAAREITDSARKIARLAHPERRDYVVIGDCPETVALNGESVACGGQIRAKMVQADGPEHPGLSEAEQNDRLRETLDQVVARCGGCGREDTVSWWESRIVPDLEAEDLLTASQLVVFIHQRTRQVVTEEAIRQWAVRGFIRRHGRDRNRTLYDRNAVLAWVRTRTKERVRTAA